MDAERRAKLVRRTVVGGSLAVFAALFVAAVYRSERGVEVYVVGALASALGVWELNRMGRPLGWRLGGPAIAAWVAGVVCVGLAFVGAAPWLSGFDVPSLAVQLGVVAVAAAVVAKASSAAGRCRLGFRVLLAVWVSCPLLWSLYVWQRFGNGGFVSLIVLSKLGDIAGYYVGSLMGRTHPFPRLSPGKTTAGCVGSLVAGTVAGVALAATGVLSVGGGGLLAGAVFGAVINVAAQAGDLFESWVKRNTRVKDSGAMFGPSGGALDVVDSFLFTVPVALVVGPLLLA